MHVSCGDRLSLRWWNLALVVTAGALFLLGTIYWIPWSDLPRGSVDPRSVFTEAQLHTLRSYASSQRHLGWTSYLLNVLLAVALALIPRIRRGFDRLPGRPSVQLLLATAVVSLVSALVALPFDWMAFQNARAAGVSVESTGLWWRDFAVSTLVGWVPFALSLLIMASAIRQFTRSWPLVLAGLAGIAVIVTSLIYPVVVAPLFTATHPLPSGPLRSAIFDLAGKEGVHLRDVVVADASTRTTAENAQVTGFGPTEQLVLDDTLLLSMDTHEVEVVVAHELGHAAHHDVLTGTLLGAAGAVAGVGLAGLLVTWRRRETSVVRGSTVPILFAVLTVGGLLVSPLENSMSRAIEARADRASLTATRDPEAFIAVQKQLDLAAKLDPTPPDWSQFWWGTHPTVLERISLAR